MGGDSTGVLGKQRGNPGRCNRCLNRVTVASVLLSECRRAKQRLSVRRGITPSSDGRESPVIGRMTMNRYVLSLKEKGADNFDSLQFASSDNKVDLFPHLCHLSYAVHLPTPSLPTTFQNYTLNSPSLLRPPPWPWTCSPPYISGLPEQTSLFSFTIGPGLGGWQTHKGPASLLQAAKETEGGYCWDTESLCITSAQT